MRDAFFTVLFSCAIGSLGCERSDEPQEAREPEVTRSSTPIAKPASTVLASAPTAERGDAGRCIEELRSPPPPPAQKAASCPHDPNKAPPKLARGKIRFAEASAASLDVEIARTPKEHERGLMYRTSLGAGRGMIFSFSDERIRTFWMKNTCIPLDMLFLASDGTVVGLLEQVPVLNEGYRSVQCPSAYVLEVNAGFSREHGVVPGMKATLNL